MRLPEFVNEFPGLQPPSGCDIPKGWEALVRELLHSLALIDGWSHAYVTQIKSKFGHLSFYYRFPDEVPTAVRDVARIVIEHYEKRADSVCEKCASPNARHTQRSGWLVTECTGCTP